MRFTRNMRQQIGQAARLGVVVAARFVSQQQAGVLERALAAGRPNSGSSRMALACGVRMRVTAILNSSIISSVIWSLVDAFGGGERLLQAAALIHGGRRDDAGVVRQAPPCVSVFLRIDSYSTSGFLFEYR